MTKLIHMLVFTLAGMLAALPAAAEQVVIVSTKNEVNSISKTDLGRIFLGKSDSFSNGEKATPINQPLSTPARTQFDADNLNRTEAQMKSYWSKILFSGEGTPPEEANGDLEVLQKVMADKSAIGYIDNSALNDAVKVLTIE